MGPSNSERVKGESVSMLVRTYEYSTGRKNSSALAYQYLPNRWSVTTGGIVTDFSFVVSDFNNRELDALRLL